MEEEAEKMAALKRAYAEIILNTSKESAARILAAERRALGFQQNLLTAKEEAVATMLRLKAVMEDKIREMEKIARCQQNKIEELELQLGEAEDTIVDLREELKRVREDLIMMKDVSVQQLSEGNINDTDMACNSTDKEASTDNLNETGNTCDSITTMSKKIADTHQCRLQNVTISEYPKNFSMQANVPELCRNGYTQRIHALDHNLSSKAPSGEINGLHSCSKCDPHTCADEKLEIAFKTDSLRSVKRAIQVKDALMFEEGCCKTLECGHEPACSGEENIKFSSDVSPRKQRALYNKSKTCSGCMLSDKQKSCIFSDGTFSDKFKSRASRSKVAVHDEQYKTEASRETSSPVSVPTEINVIEEKSIYGDASTLISSQYNLDTSMKKVNMGIKHCTGKLTSKCAKKKQNQSFCENDCMQNFLRSSDDVKDSLLSSTFTKTVGYSSAESIQKNMEGIIGVTVASRKEEAKNVAEILDNSFTVKPDINCLTTGMEHSGTDKFLKYTFQRKRKRGCSPIKNEIIFPEKKLTLKPKSGVKQTSLPVPSKSSVVTDLPRNNRRVVQVARQLISLSEKRW